MRGVEIERAFVRTDLGEDLLATLYLLLKDDGLLDILLYDRKPTLREFLDWHDRQDSRYLGAFAQPKGGSLELAGAGWLWNMRGGRADVGIVFRRKFWGPVARKLTAEMLDHTFGTFGVDVAYAITPDWNKLSQRMAAAYGFTWMGPFPKWGECHGTVGNAFIGYLEKETWVARRTR